ncbi:hypothetical protein [Streptomyces sp. NPDC000410]
MCNDDGERKLVVDWAFRYRNPRAATEGKKVVDALNKLLRQP